MHVLLVVESVAEVPKNLFDLNIAPASACDVSGTGLSSDTSNPLFTRTGMPSLRIICSHQPTKSRSGDIIRQIWGDNTRLACAISRGVDPERRQSGSEWVLTGGHPSPPIVARRLPDPAPEGMIERADLGVVEREGDLAQR